LIVDEMPTNPMYFEKMSQLLDELINERKRQALDYKKYLTKIVALTKQVSNPATSSGYPRTMNSKAKRALFDNLNRDEKLATDLDAEILRTRQDGWIDNKQKRKMVRNVIANFITDENEIDRIFELVKNQAEYKRSATDNN
jgi:type I restriction enzyme R subunit